MTDYLRIAVDSLANVTGEMHPEEAEEIHTRMATAAALVSIAQDLKRIAERLDREPIDWRKTN